jgi:hypothetical protein
MQIMILSHLFLIFIISKFPWNFLEISYIQILFSCYFSKTSLPFCANCFSFSFLSEYSNFALLGFWNTTFQFRRPHSLKKRQLLFLSFFSVLQSCCYFLSLRVDSSSLLAARISDSFLLTNPFLQLLKYKPRFFLTTFSFFNFCCCCSFGIYHHYPFLLF